MSSYIAGAGASLDPGTDVFGYCLRGAGTTPTDRTLPNREVSPPGFNDCRPDGRVTYSIAADFFLPECGARARQTEEWAIVAVPEAAVNEYSDLVSRKNEIRTTGDLPPVETEPEAAAVKG